jgi:hypothetical protein
MSSDFVRYSPDIETFDPKLSEYVTRIIAFWETKVRDRRHGRAAGGRLFGGNLAGADEAIDGGWGVAGRLPNGDHQGWDMKAIYGAYVPTSLINARALSSS